MVAVLVTPRHHFGMNPASPRSRRQAIARALDWSGRNRVAVTVERMATLGADEEKSIEEAVDRLDEQVVRRLLVSAAEWHEDVARSVRLAGAGAEERIAVLKAMVDNGLRTRRFLD
jgi:UDP-N-acetylmuramyl pentapeptide synthase